MLDEECIVPNGSDQGGSGPGGSSRISLVGSRHFFHWIGFVGKILTGNPWVFTIKLIGLSGVNFPIIQFIQFDDFWGPPFF